MGYAEHGDDSHVIAVVMSCQHMHGVVQERLCSAQIPAWEMSGVLSSKSGEVCVCGRPE